MADHFYGVNDTGSNKAVVGNVTVGTSTNSTNIELRIKDAQSISKAHALAAIEAIENYIVTHDVPA
jgi:hypothetical protein